MNALQQTFFQSSDRNVRMRFKLNQKRMQTSQQLKKRFIAVP